MVRFLSKKSIARNFNFNPITMEQRPTTNEAVWSSTGFLPSYPKLSADIQADVAVIGAGITGLSTAYHLSQAGKKVVILEQMQVGKGTTGSSTGNLYAPIDERLSSILSKHGENTLQMVAESRLAAVVLLNSGCKNSTWIVRFRGCLGTYLPLPKRRNKSLKWKKK